MSRWGRVVLSRLRGAIEGVLFLAALPVLLLHGLVCGRLAGERQRLFARWRWFAANGLRGVREAWWGTLQYESARTAWRHVLLTEWVETGVALAASAATDEIMVHIPGHIGDLLHSLPMVAELRRQKPAARLRLVVGPWCKELAQRGTKVDEVIVHAPQLVQYGRGLASSTWTVAREMRVIRQCRRYRVDTLITTSPIDPALLLFSRGVAPKRWVATGTCPDSYRAETDVILAYDRHQYEAQRIMGLLKPMGLEVPDARLGWDVDVGGETIQTLMLAGSDYFVAFAPGAGWPGKQWPAERFSRLGDWISDCHAARIVLMGSEGERELAKVIAAGMRHEVTDLVGQTSLVGAAQVLKQCALLVTNDNGLLHIAAAVGTPTLAIFGPTLPEQWAPRGLRHMVLHDGVGCTNCHPWHPRARCQEGRACMERISVEEAASAVSVLLLGEGGGCGT